MKFTATDIINATSDASAFAAKLSGLAQVKVVAGGKAEATVAVDAQVIIAVLAVTTATGAVAAKFLLAATTDYIFAGKVMTFVTDQSANTLVVIYK